MIETGSSIAPLGNVVKLQTLVTRCLERPHGTHGMGTFFGPSSDGKSFACMYAANFHGAIYIEIRSSWTKKDLCKKILLEMGIAPRGSTTQMSEVIAQNLLETERVLLVDEADYAVQKNMVEILRDIYEQSRTAVILIGEERLPDKLTKWERVHNRMLDFVGTDPASDHDIALLAGIYARDVHVDPALLARIKTECHGSVGRIQRNLVHIAEHARLHGLETVTMHDWANTEIQTLRAPQPRVGTMKRAGIG